MTCQEFLPSNYNGCIRKDRTSNGGGAMIALKSNYIVDETELSADCEIVWAKLTLKKSHPMCIGSFYTPPSDTNTDSLEELEKSTDFINGLTWSSSDNRPARPLTSDHKYILSFSGCAHVLVYLKLQKILVVSRHNHGRTRPLTLSTVHLVWIPRIVLSWHAPLSLADYSIGPRHY